MCESLRWLEQRLHASDGVTQRKITEQEKSLFALRGAVVKTTLLARFFFFFSFFAQNKFRENTNLEIKIQSSAFFPRGRSSRR